MDYFTKNTQKSIFGWLYYIFLILLIALLYQIGAYIGIRTSFTDGQIALFWPPSGICLAILFRFGKKYFLGVWLGAFLNSLDTGISSLLISGIMAVGKTLGAYIGAICLEKVRFQPEFNRQKDVIYFILYGVLLSTMISPLFGCINYIFIDIINWEAFFKSFLIWWMGDLIGVLLIGPLILSWNFNYVKYDRKFLEFTSLFVVFLLVCLIIFDDTFVMAINDLPLTFFPFAFLVWVALRFSIRAVTLTSATLSIFAIWGTTNQAGPLYQANNLHTSLLLIWIYVGVIMITALLMSAIKKEKETLLGELNQNLIREQNLNEELGRHEEELRQQLSYSDELNTKLEENVSELQKTENELQIKNDELIKANKELDRFVYSASHDLRSPISSSLGLISIALEESDIQVIKNYLKLQQKSLKKLDNFIKDIIDFSKNSKIEIVSQLIDLQELIQDVYEQYNFMENSAHIEKLIDIEANIQFYADPIRLKIILNNLISNAIHYHQPHRENPFIKVSVREYASQTILIEIEDNGRGISEEHLSKVFEMFYRATNDREVGSGLGLYIVKETIEKLGGKINISSQYGAWTKVSMFFPNHFEELLNH